MRDDADIPSLFPPRLDEEDGPARPLTAEETDALVAGAMRACGLPTRTRAPNARIEPPSAADEVTELGSGPVESMRRPKLRIISTRPPAVPRAGPKRVLRMAIIGAGLAFGTAAAALSGSWLQVVREWTASLAAPDSAPGPQRATPTPPPQRPRATAVPPPAVPESAHLVEREEGPVPVADHSSEPTEAAATQTRQAPAPVPTRPSSRPTEPDPLAVANALRADRRYDAALAQYLTVVKSGSGRQSVAARLAAATLMLEHRVDARGAIDLLLPVATSDAAIPEAVFLLGRAYDAAGDRSNAERTLRRFMRAYPEHPLRRRANTRLEGPGETAP